MLDLEGLRLMRLMMNDEPKSAVRHKSKWHGNWQLNQQIENEVKIYLKNFFTEWKMLLLVIVNFIVLLQSFEWIGMIIVEWGERDNLP